MRWVSELTLGMHVDEIRALLTAASVSFTYDDDPDEGFSRSIAFEHDGLTYTLDFERSRLTRADAWKEPRDLVDALAAIALLARARGTPVEVRAFHVADEKVESAIWIWPDRVAGIGTKAGVLSRLSCTVATQSHGGGMTLAAARARHAELSRLIAEAPPGTSDRVNAVETWRQLATWRCASLARFLDTVAAVTPDAPIAPGAFDELAEHADWLARHATLFPDPADVRDALMVDEPFDVTFEPRQLGWTVHSANEGERGVRLITGPFAYGVHHVVRHVAELHAVDPRWPLDQVIVEHVPPERSYGDKLRPTHFTARLGPHTVTLEGYEDGADIARMLVCARSST